MPTSASPSARKRFDYASLDAETSQLVQQHTGEIRGLMKRTAQGIVEIGQRLIEVKERLGHGRFGAWLKAEFDWSEGTARRFMSVARNLPEIVQRDRFEAKALYLLASPSTPQGARKEALKLAEAGEPITYTVAQAIKQKYAPPSTKTELELEPELEIIPQLQPSPTPEPLPHLGPKPQIVALRRSEQPIVPAQTLSASQPSVPAPSQPGVWWQLGERHLLYCGDPNSSEFVGRITQKISLLLAFPSAPGWLPAIQAKTRHIVDDYLPQGRNLEQLDETLESIVLFHSSLGDLVVSCFLPSPEIVSLINRLERRGLFAEPDSRRVNAVISDWKKAGLKVERLS